MGLSVRLRFSCIYQKPKVTVALNTQKLIFLWRESRDGSSEVLWSYQESRPLLSSCPAQGHLIVQNDCWSHCHHIHIPSSIIPRKKEDRAKGAHSPSGLASSQEPFCKSSPHFCLHLVDSNLVTWLCSSAKGLGSVDCQLDSLPPKITGILLLRKGKWVTDREQVVSATTGNLEERYCNSFYNTVLTFWELWSFIYYLMFHSLWSREVNIKLEDVAGF